MNVNSPPVMKRFFSSSERPAETVRCWGDQVATVRRFPPRSIVSFTLSPGEHIHQVVEVVIVGDVLPIDSNNHVTDIHRVAAHVVLDARQTAAAAGDRADFIHNDALHTQTDGPLLERHGDANTRLLQHRPG